MDTGEPPQIFLLLAGLALLFLLSMFFSSAETAFLSLNKLKLRFLCEQNHHAAVRAEKILQNKQKFLSTILIGNSIVNIAISVMLTAAALQLFGNSGLGIAVAAGTILLLIFGEILPKSIALAYPDEMSLACARLILFLMALLAPVVWLFSTVTGLLLRLCGIRGAQNTAAVTEEDLRDFFQAQEEGGFIGSDERMMLTNILRYGDFSVRSVMTPRRDIAAIHIGASAEEIISLAKRSHFSRFPVYSDNIDSIEGFFYIKDFLFSPEYLADPASFRMCDHLRKPMFVFESAKLAQVEKKFHTEQQNMAIVLDEYGGTAGLITVEDVSEEIFGSIFDEYDVQEPVTFAKTGGGAAVGQAELADQGSLAIGTEQAMECTAAAQPAMKTAVADGTLLSAVGTSVSSHGASAALHPAGVPVSGIVRNGEDTGREPMPSFTITGTVRLTDLNEQLNLSLESDYSDTIGGYIMEKAGEIPPAGYSLHVEPYTFTVVYVDATRITGIEVRECAEI